MRKEKRQEGKDPLGGSKERKEVVNDNPLASMFAKQKDVSVLNKVRDSNNTECQKGKEIGLDAAV